MLFRLFRGIINLVVMGMAILVAYILMAMGMIAGMISVALIGASEKVIKKLWIPCPNIISRMTVRQAVRQGRAFKAAGV